MSQGRKKCELTAQVCDVLASAHLTAEKIGKPVFSLDEEDFTEEFGPFLAGAGLLCLIVGPSTVLDWLPFAFPPSG